MSALWLPDGFDWKHPDYDPVWLLRAERLKKLRADPALLAGVKAYYADHPAHFIHDWGCTHDPRLIEIGLKPTIPFLLFPKQHELVEWMYERWMRREDGLVEKSRDFGASWLFMAFAVWTWLFKPGADVGIGSRKQEYVDELGDPKSLFWKARKFIDLLPAEFTPRGYASRVHAPFMKMIHPENGGTIIGEAGDSIGRGGRTSWYLIDEHAHLERPEAAEAALSMNSNCRFYVSTPLGAGNLFYRKRHSGKVPVFTCRWQDDPRKDAEWYQRQLQKFDPVIVAQEIDLDYTASVTNAFIEGTTVTEALRRGPADIRGEGPLLVGVDVARFGDDKSVITFRQGRVVFPQIVFGQCDVVDVYGRVKDAIEAWRIKPAQIAVDTIGIGSGVADMLRRDFGRLVQDVNSSLRMSDGQNYNLRARMWRQMRDFLKAPCSLPTDPELATELSALQYSYRGGELLMESKEDAKRRGIKSPDRADSLALTFAYPVRDTAEMPRHADASYEILG